jgi:D-alanyl-D-alanine carboxypeptidase/D-alanyl-D-alanine-endopeptidase (penicillin-binding protein 4)
VAASGGAASGGAVSSTAGADGTQATATSTVARSPSLNHLQAVLAREAATLGAGSGSLVGIDVEDLTTGQTLYTRDAQSTHPPASLEKLYTSAALLWLLGPAARLHTELLGTGYLFAGVWHGNLYLRGDGDPTFGDGNWNQLYEDGYGPTAAQLIAQMRRDGIKRVTGRLYADASRFDSQEGGAMTADAPDPGDYGGEMSALVYDHGLTLGKLGPAATTVHLVAVAARQSGLAVLAAPKPATTPAGAKPLATLASPPMSTMLGLMLVPSDDLFADLFAKQLGFHFYGRGTLSLGALAIRGAIQKHYGLSPTIHDGSGLDRSDRSSPADFLSLLRQMYRTPVGNVVRAGLPVVGRSGTVQDIGVKTAAAGHCEAKTGTLNNVTNLAGYCSARGGDTLAFAFMVDGPPNDDSEYAFTPMIGAVARY